MRTINIFALLFVFLIACQPKNNSTKKEELDSISLTETNDEGSVFIHVEIPLDFGFKVLYGGQVENLSYRYLGRGYYAQRHTYDHIEIRKNDIVVYVSTKRDKEYELGEEFDFFGNVSLVQPFVFQASSGKYEIFLPINDRPNNGYLRRFFVVDNEVVKRDSLPRFLSFAKYLSDDGIKKLAGFWNFGPADQGYIGFDPILYYSVTKDGLILDTLLTNEKNKMIFGGFQKSTSFYDSLGTRSYDSLGKIIIERFSKEVQRIKNHE